MAKRTYPTLSLTALRYIRDACPEWSYLRNLSDARLVEIHLENPVYEDLGWSLLDQGDDAAHQNGGDKGKALRKVMWDAFPVVDLQYREKHKTAHDPKYIVNGPEALKAQLLDADRTRGKAASDENHARVL